MSAKKDKADAASTNGKPADTEELEECFIIMPISDPDGYTSGHFQRVFEDLFVPACERAGYRAIRADQVRQTNLIHLDVLQRLIDSPMAICDLSSRNPNVLFELGLRQAFDKPVVLVQEVGTPLVFDIAPLRFTEYRREMLYRHVLEDHEKITTALNATKEAIGNSKNINSIVRLLSLTQTASLNTISERDKDSALLQVIMAEVGNLKAEVRESLGKKTKGGMFTDYGRAAVSEGSKIRFIRREVEAIENEILLIRVGNIPIDEAQGFLDDINLRLLSLLNMAESESINISELEKVVSLQDQVCDLESKVKNKLAKQGLAKE